VDRFGRFFREGYATRARVGLAGWTNEKKYSGKAVIIGCR
jgi:hypothetical protein